MNGLLDQWMRQQVHSQHDAVGNGKRLHELDRQMIFLALATRLNRITNRFLLETQIASASHSQLEIRQ